MIDTNNLEEAKKLIKLEKHPIIIKAKDDLFNRKILDYGKFDILLSPELGEKKDNLRQLDSGLNEVLTKIASKKKIAIGIDLEDLKKLTKKIKSIRLARIKQNIQICKKTKTDIKILNSKDLRNAFSLLVSLGSSTEQAQKATSF